MVNASRTVNIAYVVLNKLHFLRGRQAIKSRSHIHIARGVTLILSLGESGNGRLEILLAMPPPLLTLPNLCPEAPEKLVLGLSNHHVL